MDDKIYCDKKMCFKYIRACIANCKRKCKAIKKIVLDKPGG